MILFIGKYFQDKSDYFSYLHFLEVAWEYMLAAVEMNCMRRN